MDFEVQVLAVLTWGVMVSAKRMEGLSCTCSMASLGFEREVTFQNFRPYFYSLCRQSRRWLQRY